jgi:hypothetical protein
MSCIGEKKTWMNQFTYSLLMVLEQVNISQINAFNSRLITFLQQISFSIISFKKKLFVAF